MKKLLLVTSILTFSLSFSQSKDLTKKQALEAYKNSEISKIQNVDIKDFEINYKAAKCLSKAYNIKLKDMPLFKKKLSEKEKTYSDLEINGRFRQWIFGLDDTIFPEYTDSGTKTVTCNAFTTY